ncbi:MAG: SH3 domain-containing protein [Sneathiella sp.]
MLRRSTSRLGMIITILIVAVSCSADTEKSINETADKTADWIGEQFTVASDWVSETYSDLLNDDEQKQLSQSTEEAAKTGESQSFENKKGDIKGDVEVTKTERKTSDVSVKVLKGRLETLPPLDIIGLPYKTVKSSNVRGGPGTDFVIIDNLKQDAVVMVIGKVQDKSWYLVGDGEVANGFVYENLLSEIADTESKELTVDKISKASDDVEDEKFETEQLCRTVVQKITVADGSVREEEVTACQGPNGWEVTQ